MNFQVYPKFQTAQSTQFYESQDDLICSSQIDSTENQLCLSRENGNQVIPQINDPFSVTSDANQNNTKDQPDFPIQKDFKNNRFFDLKESNDHFKNSFINSNVNNSQIHFNERNHLIQLHKIRIEEDNLNSLSKPSFHQTNISKNQIKIIKNGTANSLNQEVDNKQFSNGVENNIPISDTYQTNSLQGNPKLYNNNFSQILNHDNNESIQYLIQKRDSKEINYEQNHNFSSQKYGNKFSMRDNSLLGFSQQLLSYEKMANHNELLFKQRSSQQKEMFIQQSFSDNQQESSKQIKFIQSPKIIEGENQLLMNDLELESKFEHQLQNFKQDLITQMQLSVSQNLDTEYHYLNDTQKQIDTKQSTIANSLAHNGEELCNNEMKDILNMINQCFPAVKAAAVSYQLTGSDPNDVKGLDKIWNKLLSKLIEIKKSLEGAIKIAVEDLIWGNNLSQVKEFLSQNNNIYIKQLIDQSRLHFNEPEMEILRNLNFLHSKNEKKRKRNQLPQDQDEENFLKEPLHKANKKQNENIKKFQDQTTINSSQLSEENINFNSSSAIGNVTQKDIPVQKTYSEFIFERRKELQKQSLHLEQWASILKKSSDYEFVVEEDKINSSTFIGYAHRKTKEKKGRGIALFLDGTIFCGYFDKNVPTCEKGIMQINNDIVYQGGFLNGLQEGKGNQNLKNGSKYFGEFQKGKRNGKGVMISQNDRFFLGEIENDLPHGFGEMSRIGQNNVYEIYRGNFKKGKKDGVAILYSGILSEWKDDKFIRILQNNTSNN